MKLLLWLWVNLFLMFVLSYFIEKTQDVFRRPTLGGMASVTAALLTVEFLVWLFVLSIWKAFS